MDEATGNGTSSDAATGDRTRPPGSGSFLLAMAAGSAERVATARRDEPVAALRRRAAQAPPAPPLRATDFVLIAEIKRASPASDTAPLPPRIAERVAAYVDGGAAAISVLTEPARFGGSLADLRAAAGCAGDVPVLRKDFVVDPYQVLEARAAGAGGVLLIAELLDDAALALCIATARRLGMFVLVEAFGPAQLRRARSRATPVDVPAPVLCGVNCRDLHTLAVDPGRFAALAADRDAAPTIAESGLHGADDVAAVARLGYRGALVGTALMHAADPRAALARMVEAGRRVRCASS